MGKGHIESFMRTFAYFVEHLPGQRGGTFRRQPAALALKGVNRETGFLDYQKGSQIHDGALLQYANRALEYIEDGLEGRIAAWQGGKIHQISERLKVESLKPVSWILEGIREAIAYYNTRTDHRMEGFSRIEYQDAQGRRLWRMESPNERAAELSKTCTTDRLSVGAASFLIRTKVDRVRVTRNGVTLNISPLRGLRFWSERSRTCAEAMRLATGEKYFMAAYDPEGIVQGTSGEIYLLEASEGMRGDEPARFVEALPLVTPVDRANPEALAAELARVKSVEQRTAAAMVAAAAPHVANRLADAKHNLSVLREVATTTIAGVRGNTIDAALKFESAESSGPSRADVRESAEQELARMLNEEN